MKNLYKSFSMLLMILSGFVIGLAIFRIFFSDTIESTELIEYFYSFLFIPKIIILISLIKTGQLINNTSKVRFWFYVISAFILFIGIILKIMHWPFFFAFIFSGVLIFLITYCIHFIKKKQKNVLDFIKFLWLFLVFFSLTYSILHLPGKYFLFSIAEFIFWLMAFLFGLQQFKKYSIRDKQITEE